MRLDIKRTLSKAVVVTALFCMTTQTTFAALLNIAQEPLLGGSTPPPKVMLTISKDQQLFKKAYNDYTDLDGDGVIETTYKHSVDYYGYFDSYKCYQYSVPNGRFEPQAYTDTKYCSSGLWSGNFLNWISMSRMDAVRKLLYGGLRSTDQTFGEGGDRAVTVLERAYLPTDAHAWAKYYDGADIDRLTPFNTVRMQPAFGNAETARRFTIPAATGDYDITFSNSITFVSPGDQVRIARRSRTGEYLIGAVLSISDGAKTLRVRVNSAGVAGAGATDDYWLVTNLSSTGISFCNLTVGSTNATDPNSRSSTNANPPVIRVAAGNFALWNANERWQCQWAEERNNIQGGFEGGLRSNGNQASLSEIYSSAENPSRPGHGLNIPGTLNAEYIARVKVCDPAFQLDPSKAGTEKCKRYPNGNLKPIGLLQEYGDRGAFHFGLMTGSYAKNISGGVLRKNPGPLSDEVRTDTDGVFREANADGTYRLNPYRPRQPATSPRNSTSEQSPPGIINTLNYMRIYGYTYTDGSYLGAAGDNCTYQLTSVAENQCTSWGNPMSEIFFEAVRYFAGKPETPAYVYTSSGSKDNELGLPLAKFVDPLNRGNYCSPLNVLVFNASVADNDDDLRNVSAAAINATGTIAGLTNAVGGASNENIQGGRYFAGKLVGSSPTGSSDAGFELCTAKTITGLGDISGICPEGPTTGGSYLMAGIAHHARTNPIRTDLPISASDQKSLRITSYGINLSANVPEIVIPVGSTGRRVVIQPIYRLNAPGGVGGGAIVDMRYVKQQTVGTVTSGKIYVNWEDSEQGGDYDQDMWGTIDWRLDTATNRVTITTNAISASTANPQGFGYAISGTTRDGPHFHSGIYGFNYTDPTGVLGCTNCNLIGSGGQTGPQSVTYDLAMGGTTANTLKDPLWYLAKYGGFIDNNDNKRPDLQSEWDSRKANGQAGSDNTPDNYFLVTNPIGLADKLAAAFQSISNDSAGAAVMANSTSLRTVSRVYQARYISREWAGQLLAKDIDPVTRVVNSTATWDAGRVLNSKAATDRVILTFDDVTTRDGVAFRSGSISPTLSAALNVSPDTGTADGLGAQRLDYLRGDARMESARGGPFRTRPNTKLGDIVSSDPAYVGTPDAQVVDRTYADFRKTYYARTPMLYVGANDGMLHGFDAVTGEEKLAYIPSKTFRYLNQLTSENYRHRFYVDGAPEVADAVVGGRWRTVLVGSLGAGGQGLYALDVTDPGTFSERNASRIALWEFNDRDDPALGYVLSKPVIRKMSDNRWAAIVSAGYNNSEGDLAQGSGTATLFVIFLDGPTGPGRTWIEGTDYIKIDTGVGDRITPNGLAGPFAADINADGRLDFVYAGDLQGNFWKFDLTDTNPRNWPNAANRVLLFTAKDASGNRQPITGPAEGTFHPTGSGFVLSFGTGKFIEPTDNLPPFAAQSYYGIWDKNDKPGNVATQTVVTSRSQLLEQTMAEPQPGVRTITNRVPNWSTELGWFIDFPNSATTGERSVFRPLLMAGRLMFTTLIPNPDPCEPGGGKSPFMIVSPTTGGRIDAVLDISGDGVINAEDKVSSGGTMVYASGVDTKVGVTPTPVVVRGAAAASNAATSAKIFGSSAPYLAGEQSALGLTFLGGPLGVKNMWIGLGANSGRVSWREIVTN